MLTNHLWQSTCFLLAAAALTLTLRRHRAETRYWVWMASSIKFLVPFSLLTSLGTRFAWRTSGAAQDGILQMVGDAAQPFHPAPAVPPFTHPHSIPVAGLLATAWLAGFAAVLFRWTGRYRAIRATLAAADPIHSGRELSVLRGIAPDTRVALLRSQTMLEPGVFGIFRPKLVLPASILEHLDDDQLGAIFLHELSHVRRRDNLAAALHMLVEAVFWFHPPVWWLGARLVEERERACDEDVLRGGSAPHKYAQGILHVCRLCLESPLPCAAGVTGADLNRRIERIMGGGHIRQMGAAHRVLLSAAALFAVAAPVLTGALSVRTILAQTPHSAASAAAFDAVSIKLSSPGLRGSGLVVDPGRLRVINLNVKQIIGAAFNLSDFRISAPDGLPTEHYDITATIPGHASREFDRPLQLMLQGLLTERFHLAYHREQKIFSHYALVTAKGGPKLKPSDQPGYSTRSGPGTLNAWGLSMDDFAEYLTRRLDRPVVDASGVSGRFDLTLNWSPDETQSNPEMPNPNQTPAAADETRPSIFKALEEQLGLRLEGRKGPVEILVVDHAEKAAGN